MTKHLVYKEALKRFRWLQYQEENDLTSTNPSHHLPPPPRQKKRHKNNMSSCQLQFMTWKIQPKIYFREGVHYQGATSGELPPAGTSNGFSDFPTLVGNTTETKVSVQFTASEAVGNAWIQILPSSDVSGETWESGKTHGSKKKLGRHVMTGWWFQTFFIFTPIWGDDPIWRAYFSDGLKPPSRWNMKDMKDWRRIFRVNDDGWWWMLLDDVKGEIVILRRILAAQKLQFCKCLRCRHSSFNHVWEPQILWKNISTVSPASKLKNKSNTKSLCCFF